jgi:ATP-binding cassette subfamily F protein uup
VLAASGLSFSHPGGKVLFDEISLVVENGERVALVGENGTGKSTLLSVLAGKMSADGGTVTRVRNATVALLAQAPALDDEMTVIACVRDAMKALNDKVARHRELCDLMAASPDDAALSREIDTLAHAIDAAGGFSTEHRVEEVLSRLGVVKRDEKIGTLSGGEKRRVDLARLLLSAPDVMLLDEPTNHLDVGAIRFLEDTLIAFPGAVLFVSHDRMFMNRVGTRILELDGGRLFTHLPPYENFLENRLVRMDIEGRTLQKKERLLAREIAWVRAGTPARTTKQTARLDRASALIDDVTKDARAQREKTLALRKGDTKRLGKTILEMKKVRVERGGRLLFRDLDLIVTAGQRFGIVGPNGAGKSSFLSLVDGTLAPTGGEVVRGAHTSVARLDQDRGILDEKGTVEDVLCPENDHVFVGKERIHIASYLESFLFDPRDRRRQVKTLSGGEKTRLGLALALKEGANVLLLDEPTNDLDVATLGVLEEALHEHEGVAFIVSHDRAFLDRVVTGMLAFEPQSDGTSRVTHVPGDWTHYERTQQERLVRAEQTRAVVVDKAPAVAKKKETTKRTFNEERELKGIEEKILALETRKAEIDALLADGQIFVKDAKRGTALTVELGEVNASIETTYARWAELDQKGG